MDTGRMALSCRSHRPLRTSCRRLCCQRPATRKVAFQALQPTIAVRRPPRGLIHRSDRGSRYCALDYRAAPKARGLTLSLSGKGNCYDTAMVETVLKTRHEAETAVARYIESFYNPVRRHLSLRDLSPVQLERIAPLTGKHLSTSTKQVQLKS